MEFMFRMNDKCTRLKNGVHHKLRLGYVIHGLESQLLRLLKREMIQVMVVIEFMGLSKSQLMILYQCELMVLRAKCITISICLRIVVLSES